MTITYFFLTLNHHEAPVVDELYKLIGNDLTFVELVDMSHSKEGKKGSTEVFSNRPYLLKAWENPRNEQKAMELARTSDVAMFCGYPSLRYEIERLKENRLSFEVSERWLKRGLYGILSPRLIKVFLNYHIRNWRNRPLYRLCSSAFAASDHTKLGMYKGRCYKWGYFTKVDCDFEVEAREQGASTSEITPIMWCSRYLMWKHPELPVLLAERLKKAGYKFHLDMYGEGEYKKQAMALAEELDVTDVVSFIDNKPNIELMEDMKKHEVFLFTSDKNEGWGAVANESMSNGCVLVTSNTIGSTPYLVSEGFNGLVFQSSKPSYCIKNPDMAALDSLYEKVVWLLEHPDVRKQMQLNAMRVMQDVWSPKNAAKSLLQLIKDLQAGRDTSIINGPCSKA